MTDNERQGGRLKELISALKITQSAFAQRLKVTRGYISILVSGDKPISQAVLNGIANCYPKVNMNWLISGTGEMFVEKNDVSSVPEPGLLTGVMEPPPPLYEPMPHGGIFEGALARIAELERRVEEISAEIRGLKQELEECRSGKGNEK